MESFQISLNLLIFLLISHLLKVWQRKIIDQWAFQILSPCYLKIGEISASFSLSGKTPLLIQELKMFVSMGAQVSLFSLSNLIFTPVVDFVWSNLFNSDETSSTENFVKSNVSGVLLCSIATILGWFWKRVMIFSKASFLSFMSWTCALQLLFVMFCNLCNWKGADSFYPLLWRHIVFIKFWCLSPW